jgi:hypothetical protein
MAQLHNVMLSYAVNRRSWRRSRGWAVRLAEVVPGSVDGVEPRSAGSIANYYQSDQILLPVSGFLVSHVNMPGSLVPTIVLELCISVHCLSGIEPCFSM